MSDFVFVEKISELYFWIRPEWQKIYVHCPSDNKKYEMKEWIENTCQCRVIVFGRSRYPYLHEFDWQKVICGDGSIDIYFENDDEATLFKLTWGSDNEKLDHEYEKRLYL